MKKKYMKPEMEVVLMKAEGQLLAGSGTVGNTSVGAYWDTSADDEEEGL